MCLIDYKPMREDESGADIGYVVMDGLCGVYADKEWAIKYDVGVRYKAGYEPSEMRSNRNLYPAGFHYFRSLLAAKDFYLRFGRSSLTIYKALFQEVNTTGLSRDNLEPCRVALYRTLLERIEI